MTHEEAIAHVDRYVALSAAAGKEGAVNKAYMVAALMDDSAKSSMHLRRERRFALSRIETIQGELRKYADRGLDDQRFITAQQESLAMHRARIAVIDEILASKEEGC